MSSIQLSQIITYPLKSAAGIELPEATVTPRGLNEDRHWVIFDRDGNMITARKYPKLLALLPETSKEGLILKQRTTATSLVIPYPSHEKALRELEIFSEPATGVLANQEANDWLSAYLDLDCQLFFMNDKSHRQALQGRGGQPDDVASYADEAPILLVSEESLADLNSKLQTPISMKHFRPNLVVSGCEAFAEDTWKFIQLGECEFEIAQRCKRCVFTTINPETLEKNADGEPLRTLATYRKHEQGGVGFGVHIIPRKLGKVRLDDQLTFR